MTTIGVGVVVSDAQGRVLAGWRVKDPTRPCWSLPGGHIEPGESPAAAALRELAEETALRGSEARPFVLLVDRWQDATRTTIGVEVRIADTTQEPQVTEPATLSRWEWLDAPEEPLFSATRHVLDAWYGRSCADGVARHYFADTVPAGLGRGESRGPSATQPHPSP